MKAWNISRNLQFNNSELFLILKAMMQKMIKALRFLHIKHDSAILDKDNDELSPKTFVSFHNASVCGMVANR